MLIGEGYRSRALLHGVRRVRAPLQAKEAAAEVLALHRLLRLLESLSARPDQH